MRKIQTLVILLLVTTTMAFSQKIIIDGYAFEEYNRGFLNEVKVTILDITGVFIGEVMSDTTGHFVYNGIDAGKEYVAQYEKKIFKTVRDTFSTVGKKIGDKIFLKRQIDRQPGYLLEVTLAEKRINYDLPVDAINGCRVEIFNVTKNKEELVIDSIKSPVFSLTLQQGNQYAVLIRKKGFFTKRMNANVNINGCYLCMDGFGSVTPGVTSNLTSAEDNKLGTLLSNIELERIDTSRNITMQNIYYPLASAELTDDARKELDKVVGLMKNNGALIIELGSHTDSRGSEESNMKLSQARAQAAVNYITSTGWVESNRIKARGYGESRLTNKCEDGTPCSEAEHLRNRRTELRIIGFTEDANEQLSLAEIIHKEEMMKFILSGESEKQYSSSSSTGTFATPQAEPNSHTPQPALESPKMRQPTPSVKSSSVPKNITPQTAQAKMQSLEQSVKPMEQAKASENTQKVDMVKETVNINLSGIDNGYTGYKVELFKSDTELAVNDPDLKIIGADILSSIQVDKLKNGQFSYMVGSFLNWNETERFLDKAQAKYPKAQIVDYYNGKRVGE